MVVTPHISGEEVLQIWLENESDPVCRWEEVYLPRGYSSLSEWRGVFFSFLRIADRDWSQARLSPEDLSEVFYGPYLGGRLGGWYDSVHRARFGEIAERADERLHSHTKLQSIAELRKSGLPPIIIASDRPRTLVLEGQHRVLAAILFFQKEDSLDAFMTHVSPEQMDSWLSEATPLLLFMRQKLLSLLTTHVHSAP